jgi:hypothetical protein
MERKESRPAMNIKQGEIFRNSTDGVDFIVKKVVKDMVVLESDDGKRQILTGVDTLTSTLFYLKQGGEKNHLIRLSKPFQRGTIGQDVDRVSGYFFCICFDLSLIPLFEAAPILLLFYPDYPQLV